MLRPAEDDDQKAGRILAIVAAAFFGIIGVAALAYVFTRGGDDDEAASVVSQTPTPAADASVVVVPSQTRTTTATPGASVTAGAGSPTPTTTGTPGTATPTGTVGPGTPTATSASTPVPTPTMTSTPARTQASSSSGMTSVAVWRRDRTMAKLRGSPCTHCGASWATGTRHQMAPRDFAWCLRGSVASSRAR